MTVPNQHWIRAEVSAVLLRLALDGRYALTFRHPARKPYTNNLHHIVNEFMAGPADFWLSIDADNPPKNNPLDLVSYDRDVIGLPTPIWHYTGQAQERPVYWNGYDWDDECQAFREHQDREGIQRVDAIGTGCFLIARRVFEDHPELRKGAFARIWNEDGTVEMGNDMAFCRRATALGVEIYCHYDYPCDHYSEVELNRVAEAFKAWKAVV